MHAARKATHGLDGQHQDVDRTLRGRVNQNDRGQGKNGESTSMVCGQPSDRWRLNNRTEQYLWICHASSADSAVPLINIAFAAYVRDGDYDYSVEVNNLQLQRDPRSPQNTNRKSYLLLGNESVSKVIENSTINLFFKLQSAFW